MAHRTNCKCYNCNRPINLQDIFAAIGMGTVIVWIAQGIWWLIANL